MAGLPKIALARLKANPEAQKSASAPLGPNASQGADHPDANLLAAFVEKTLTEKERTQVLNHLSQCAECREIAALTLPAEVAAAEPAPVTVRRRWNPWLFLRWGAMAAVLGALTVVVVKHPGMWNGHPEISQSTRPPAPEGKVTSNPQAVSAPPPAPPTAAPVQADARFEARGSAQGMADTAKALERPRDHVVNDQLTSAEAKQQVATRDLSRQSATFKTENVPAAHAEREESGESKKEGSAVTAETLPAPSPPSPPSPPAAPGVASAASPAEATKPGPEPQPSPAALPATNQTVEVTGVGAGGFGGGRGGGVGEASATKTAPQVAAQASIRMAAQAPMTPLRASHKDAALDTGPPATLWSVSSSGNVQRSTDGGKTFKQIQIARGIKFTAIAALGSEIWTGGNGGALFHTTDGGDTWYRIGIHFEGNTIRETIEGIRLLDPQHLAVTTASGSQWVSEDGGQDWRKKP